MFTFILFLTLIVPIALLFVGGATWVYGYMFHEKVISKKKVRLNRFCPISEVHTVAVLIACRNGESNIGATVQAASRNGCKVFVVSDASGDDTADRASLAGAEVLVLENNVGKPRALFLGYEHFDLSARFQAVAILDDDVIIESDFVARSIEKMDLNTAIVVGKNLTLWPKEHRWNVWLAKRSYSYWNYQLINRRLQSFFGVMSCISGSNSVYRTELLDKVLPERPPYIVDDTFWVLEAQRKDYGRIVYAPKARAHLQDPTNFRDWYKQNLRWLWGTFQGIVGHDVGKKRTRFDVAYVFLIIQWLIYVCFLPFSIWFMFTTGSYYIFLGFYLAWVAAAALQLRQLRLMLFAPAIIVVDLIYRVVFIHAVIKTFRQPTVENCVWDSPARFTTT